MVRATASGDAGGTVQEGAGGRRRRSASVSDLLRSLVADVTLIARREVELATIELKTKASEYGGAAALLGAGAVVGFLALGALVAAAVLALALVLPAWAAATIVGTVLIAVAALLGLAARARLRTAGSPAPTATIDMVQEDIAWMRSETARLQPSE